MRPPRMTLRGLIAATAVAAAAFGAAARLVRPRGFETDLAALYAAPFALAGLLTLAVTLVKR